LLEAGTVTLNDVSRILDVPEAVVTAGYEQIKAERAAPEEIVDLTADTTASTIDSGELDFEGKAKDPLADYKLNPELYTYDYVSAQLFEMIANETNAELRDGLIEEYEGLSGQAYDPNKPIQPIKKSDSQIQEEAAAAKIENAARTEAAEKEAAWGNVDKNLPLDQIVQAVINIFGTGNEGVAKVIDIANQRGSTAGDIATAAGISIEDVNAAAKTAGVTINTTPDDAAADDATGCPEGSGKIDDGAGNCVCPEGFSENDSGVCETDTDILDVINTITGAVTDETIDTDLTEIVTGGGCTGGKIDDGFGNCVCPEGEVEIDGVCQAAGGGGGCTGGKIDDGFGNCVCPEGEVEIDGVCQAAAAIAACALSGGIMVNGVCVDVDGDDDDDDDEGGCTGGKIDDGFGNCVCPEGEVEIDGVCQAAGGGGGCTGGKVDDGAGNCVCPEGKVEDANGVCQAAGGGGACTGGRTRDPITDECVCPSDKPNFNAATQQCEGVGGGGQGACTGGRTRDPITDECVCPSDKPNFNAATQQCEGVGSGGQGACTGGRTRDPITDECVCPSDKPNFNAATQQCEGVGGGGQGACTGGRTRDPITDECVCPSDKPNFNAATQQCEGVGPGTGPGECLGGKTRDPVTQQCVCPQGTEDVNGQCVGTGSGECPEGQTRDIFGNCVAPEPETTQAVPDLFSVVQTKPGEKVGAIDFYDISGPSIFRSGAKTEEEEDPLAYLYSNYADGGIVQDNDIEELIRYLENTRG
jgi:hypothetical protein